MHWLQLATLPETTVENSYWPGILPNNTKSLLITCLRFYSSWFAPMCCRAFAARVEGRGVGGEKVAVGEVGAGVAAVAWHKGLCPRLLLSSSVFIFSLGAGTR